MPLAIFRKPMRKKTDAKSCDETIHENGFRFTAQRREVYGAIMAPWAKPQLVSLDEAHPVAPATAEAPGDLMGSYFNPDGTLGVVWTRRVLSAGTTLERDIYYARSK